MKTTELHISAKPGNGWMDTTITRYGKDKDGFTEPAAVFPATTLPPESLPLFGAVVAALITTAAAGSYILKFAIMEPAGEISLLGEDEGEGRPIIGKRRAFVLACTQHKDGESTRERTERISTEALPEEARDAAIALWDIVEALEPPAVVKTEPFELTPPRPRDETPVLQPLPARPAPEVR